MPDFPERHLQRMRLLWLTIIFVAGVAVAVVLMVGNPIIWVMNQFRPGVEVTQTDSLLSLSKTFENKTWLALVQHGMLPIKVGEHGRPNPFVEVAPVSSPIDRDAQRLNDVQAVRDALRAHERAYGNYPTGSQVIVGSIEAACLTDKGWQPRGYCVFNVGVVPMPADPEAGQYLYEATDTSYTITFTLENGTQGYSAGPHVVTPEGIK